MSTTKLKYFRIFRQITNIKKQSIINQYYKKTKNITEGISKYFQENENKDKFNKEVSKYIYLSSSGDGNCFFNAIVRSSHYSKLGKITRKQEKKEATHLRKIYIEWFKANKKTVGNKKDTANYIKNMKDPAKNAFDRKRWGGNTDAFHMFFETITQIPDDSKYKGKLFCDVYTSSIKKDFKPLKNTYLIVFDKSKKKVKDNIFKHGDQSKKPIRIIGSGLHFDYLIHKSEINS